MYKSILVRILVTAIGLGIITVGGIVGVDLGLRVLGIISFEKVHRSELTIKATRQQRLPQSKMPTNFNLVQRSGENFVIVGDLENTNNEQLILDPTTQWSNYSMEMFGVPVKYQVIPSLIGFYTQQVIGSIVSIIVGGILLGVARDLWLIDAIVLGQKKSWVLQLEIHANHNQQHSH
jgi:hypothetical protein